MSDLMSRKALLQRIKNSTAERAVKVLAQVLVNTAPAVDAVEVVRCKDCRRFKPHEERPEFGFCKLYPLGLAKHENGFCEHGERKENEEE